MTAPQHRFPGDGSPNRTIEIRRPGPDVQESASGLRLLFASATNLRDFPPCSERQTSEARTCTRTAVPPIIVSPDGPHPSIHPCRGRSFLLLSGLSGNLWSVFLVTRYDRPAGLRFAGWHPRLHFPECSFFGGVVPSVLPPFVRTLRGRWLPFLVANVRDRRFIGWRFRSRFPTFFLGNALPFFRLFVRADALPPLRLAAQHVRFHCFGAPCKSGRSHSNDLFVWPGNFPEGEG